MEDSDEIVTILLIEINREVKMLTWFHQQSWSVRIVRSLRRVGLERGAWAEALPGSKCAENDDSSFLL